MTDIRRSILWVILVFSLILLWDQWQLYNGREATFFPTGQPPATAPVAADASAPAAAATLPPAMAAAPANAALPTATVLGAQPDALVPPAPAPAAPRETVTVRTDAMELTFDTQGGALIGATLLRHFEEVGRELRQTQTPLRLFKQDGERTYVAQTGLIGGDFPNHTTPMRLVSGPPQFAPGQTELTLRFESEPVGGVVLAKIYTVARDAHVIGVRHEVRNSGAAAVTPQVYVQLVRDGLQAGSDVPFYYTFTGPVVYTDLAKFQQVEFEQLAAGEAEFQRTASDGYVGMVQHYFASAWLLPQGVERENFMRMVGPLYSVGSISALGSIAPGEVRAFDSRLFVGPQYETELELIAPGLDLLKDYGWLTVLAKPMYWLLYQIHALVANWGWAIVLLVVLIRAAFYWLNSKAYRSMAKMKAINPRMMEMRERLKDNPQLMQQEMMKLYREEKVNPLGGCLPILIQIPVFIALYWVLLASVEMRNAPWVLWISDLSTPDPFFILPLLMMVTTVIQTALNPLPPDPLQAKLMWILPFVFSIMFFFFPAGLVLYWLVNNVLTIAQQAYINNKMGVPLKFTLPNFKS
ncbi:membrane protein insertase YidC [Serpentinimonas barnesii]|uniref:membrane protein insertase YidC n=1 Tax=Serpentinimonas barnesii TaxID=1458427 RepID=UPI000496522E|nr:membrane protein insertase YidC [Serpentinimonas barnesii]